MSEETGDKIVLQTGAASRQVELLFDMVDENGNSVPQYVQDGAFQYLNKAISLEITSNNEEVLSVVPIADEPASKFALEFGDSKGEAVLQVVVISTATSNKIGVYYQPFELTEDAVIVGEPVDARHFKLQIEG